MNQPGYDFDENQAKFLVKSLRDTINILSESADYVSNNSSPEAATPYRRKIAEVLFVIGWEMLEQGFYKRYSGLRPEDSELNKNFQDRANKNFPDEDDNILSPNSFEK